MAAHIETMEMMGTKKEGGGKLRSIMDIKAFNKMDTFKGTGWLKWKGKFMSLARLAHLRAPALLQGAATHAAVIVGNWEDPFKLFTYADQEAFGADLIATLQFLLEGEPLDILNNCAHNGSGTELWRRLDRRYNAPTRSKELNDMNGVLNPECAKSMRDVMGGDRALGGEDLQAP